MLIYGIKNLNLSPGVWFGKAYLIFVINLLRKNLFKKGLIKFQIEILIFGGAFKRLDFFFEFRIILLFGLLSFDGTGKL